MPPSAVLNPTITYRSLFHGESGTDGEVWDLADLTLQCGRKADSLKLALGWVYYGKEGYERQIDHAFDTAAYMASQVSESPNLLLISERPPPCLQVCFYYARDKNLQSDADAYVILNVDTAQLSTC